MHGTTEIIGHEGVDDLRAQTGTGRTSQSTLLFGAETGTVIFNHHIEVRAGAAHGNRDMAILAAFEPMLHRIGDELGQHEGQRRGILSGHHAELAHVVDIDMLVFHRGQVHGHAQQVGDYLVEVDDFVGGLAQSLMHHGNGLLRAVLHTKHLMNPEVLATARRIVRQVVEEIMARLAKEVRQAFSGVRDRRRRSSIPLARNFDFKSTLRANLQHWHPQHGKLYIESPRFNSRIKRQSEQWQLVLLVDQSGSMVDSVIHSAVMAACLWQLPGIRTHLVAFDTSVVDLTADVADPVELLMKVQLGGGTNIASAVEYGRQLIEQPAKSVIILVSDFYEGGSSSLLTHQVKKCVQSGIKVLGLAALDSTATPCYDHDTAQALVNVGAQIAAMTPGELASWLAENLQS